MSLAGWTARALRYAARTVANAVARIRDRASSPWAEAADAPLETYLALPPAEVLRSAVDFDDLCAILDHRFDLLGSGPVKAESPPAGGLERLPARARARAARIRAGVGPSYAPIDWHLDFKSGHRWHEGTWYRDVPIGRPPGADVKVPWELARMQHLPRLACAHAAAKAGVPGLPAPERLASEFRDQVLDFAASNPPRFGVNWACAMDVALRLCNILLAHDLFRAGGAAFDAAFEAEIGALVLSHGRHVAREMDREFRGNHFLADVAGLLFAAAYLPDGPESRAWLARARDELLRETAHQFLADGGSFEASTSYHRLSGEIVVYATALGTAAARRGRLAPWPEEHLERLRRIVAFDARTAKPSGLAPQIGDNDNGRFANFDVREAVLDHASFRAAAAAALGLDGDGRRVEAAILRPLAAAEPRPPRAPVAFNEGDPAAFDREKARVLSGLEVFETRIGAPWLLAEGGLRREAFPDFGLYLWTSPRFYLAVRCGPPGQDGLGGHAHNDALAVELWIDGADWWADPGTHAYTGDPDRRNRYRSVRAHFAPQPRADVEPSGLARNLFLLEGDPRALCLAFCDRGFLGVHAGFGSPVYRVVELVADGVRILDAATPGLLRPMLDGPPGPRTPNPAGLPFSPGYGR